MVELNAALSAPAVEPSDLVEKALAFVHKEYPAKRSPSRLAFVLWIKHDFTQSDIADLFCVTDGRISQMLKAVSEKLRHRFRKDL